MDKFSTIHEMVLFIENRIAEGVTAADAARAVGFSEAYAREIFRESVGVTLAGHIARQRMAHAAFDLLHDDASIQDIAARYGYACQDTFARAFRRASGYTPGAFRKKKPPVHRVCLCEGVYCIGFGEKEDTYAAMRARHTAKELTQTKHDAVLYGVPKLRYGLYGGCTAPAICMKACADYLGADVPYHTFMAASGAAFRIAWENVPETGYGAYAAGMRVMGYRCDSVSRASGATRDVMLRFMKDALGRGMPVVAVGLMPDTIEPGIVTGYRNDGDTLLDWNFLQEYMGYSARGGTDASGYYAADDWWENGLIASAYAPGERDETGFTPQDAAALARETMHDLEHIYAAWKALLLEEDNAYLSERLMRHGNALDSLADGRLNAAKVFAGHPAAAYFDKVTKACEAMYNRMGGWQRGEEQLTLFGDARMRKELAALVESAEKADLAARDAMRG